MAKEKKSSEKISLFGYNPVETPEEVIDSDKNVERKEAFKESYKRVMKIIPDYFLTQKRKKSSGSTSGGFSQSIIVTPENVKIETKEEVKTEEKVEEKAKERED